MGSALVYVVVVALVAGVVYLAVALLFGRGEELAPMPPGATPTRLPARDLQGTDVRDLRFQQTLRGYKCSEVDWALERLASEVDALRARLAVVDGAGPGTEAPGRADPANGVPRARWEPADAADGTPTDPSVRADAVRDGARRGESATAGRGMSGPDGGDVPR